MRLPDKLLHLLNGVPSYARQHHATDSMPRTRIAGFAVVLSAACAAGVAAVAPLAPDAADLPVKKITQQLDLPKLDQQIAALAESEQHFIREENVRRGDTLASLLKRLGIDDEEAEQFIKSDAQARNLLQLRADKAVRAQTNADGDLLWLQTTFPETSDKPARNLEIRRTGEGKFSVSDADAKLERRIEMAAGNIRSSLFAATDEAHISDAISTQIVTMFETNIDFRRLQRGDHFNVVYESFWLNGQLVKTGRVLAGEFTNSGKTYQSVWFDESGGPGGYYTFDGKSLKKAFLKSPLEFTRVSSGFSMRVHPISGQWKQHKGVDFAATTGTPIRATADGIIDSVGRSGGYGNLVVVKHHSSYSTAYAHMSRFANNLRKGSRVSQGEVIGYVGSTGWSTGPHLHYEFRVNNEPRDPLSAILPEAPPLAAHAMPRFKTQTADMVHRFNLLRPERKEAMKLASR